MSAINYTKKTPFLQEHILLKNQHILNFSSAFRWSIKVSGSTEKTPSEKRLNGKDYFI